MNNTAWEEILILQDYNFGILITSAAKEMTEHRMLRALQVAKVVQISPGSQVVKLPMITRI